MARKAFSFIHTVLISLGVVFVFYLLGLAFSYSENTLNSYCLSVAFVYFILLSFCLGMFVSRRQAAAGNKERLVFHLSFIVVMLGVALFVELVKFSLLPGITIVVVLISVLYLGGLAAWFTRRHFAKIGSLLFKLLKLTWERRERHNTARADNVRKRRSFQRYADNVKLLCSCCGKEWECFSHDISATGLRVLSRRHIEAGKAVKVIIYISGSNRPIYAKGEAVWAEPAGSEEEGLYYVGIRFLSIEPADKIRLVAKYIFKAFS